MTSFEYMREDTVIAKVIIEDNDKITVINYTDDIIDRPFGTCTSPGRVELNRLYAERCFPANRVDAMSILRGKPYGYDPARIVRDTHGVMIDDCYWLRFNGEDLCWDDVKVRK